MVELYNLAQRYLPHFLCTGRGRSRQLTIPPINIDEKVSGICNTSHQTKSRMLLLGAVEF